MRQLEKIAEKNHLKQMGIGGAIGAGLGAAGNAVRTAYQDRGKKEKRSLGRAALKGGLGGAAIGGTAGGMREALRKLPEAGKSSKGLKKLPKPRSNFDANDVIEAAKKLPKP